MCWPTCTTLTIELHAAVIHAQGGAAGTATSSVPPEMLLLFHLLQAQAKFLPKQFYKCKKPKPSTT